MLREIVNATAARVKKDLKDQPEVEADLRATLGSLYSDLGEYANAVAMHREALRIRSALFGQEHAAAASSLNDLGLAMWQNGNSAEAETIIRQSLRLRRQLLGHQHPDVARSLYDLGQLLWYHGRSAESEAMQREALEMRRRVFGNQHPDVGKSLVNLAWSLMRQGKLAEAETMNRDALLLLRKLYGDEHPDIAWVLCNQSVVFHGQKKLPDAEALQREALAMRRKLLGPAHPVVVDSLNNLANVQRDRGKLSDAETTYRQALAVVGKSVSEEHPSNALLLKNLTNMLLKARRLADAEKVLNEALTPAFLNQPACADVLRLRADVLAGTGRWEAAIKDFARLQSYQPANHEIYHALAALRAQVGDLEGYRRICAQALDRFRNSRDPAVSERVAKDCLMLRDSQADMTVVADLADRAIKLGANSGMIAWYQTTGVFSSYRQEKWAEAVEQGMPLAYAGTVQPARVLEASAVVAMSLQKLGQTEAAQEALAWAIAVEKRMMRMEQKVRGVPVARWIDWIVAHLLLREGRAMIAWPSEARELAMVQDAEARQAGLWPVAASPNTNAPTTAVAYNSRGFSKQMQGDFDGAIADFDHAVAIDPTHALAYTNRANTRHAGGEFEAALADYDQGIAVAQDNAPYARLYRYLIQRRLNREAAPAELSRGFASENRTWTRTVARFFVGEVTEANLFAAANRGTGKTPQSRPCESFYFAGMMALLNGEREHARVLFEKSVATNETARSAFMLARAELARISASAKSVPPAR